MTESGRAEAIAWLTGVGASPAEDWDDVLDRILLASSLPGADLDSVLEAYSSAPLDGSDPLDEHPQRRLAARASLVRDEALRHLLDAARDELSKGEASSGVRGFAVERPRRGRRAGSRDETGTGAVA